MNKPDRLSNLTSPKTGFGPVQLVVIQPTTFCNLDCDYCYLPQPARNARHQLSLDLLEPIFTNLFQSKLIQRRFTVVWHAGEPLTVAIAFYDSAFRKIEQLNRELNPTPYEISHSFQTNGILLNQDWCDLIKKYNLKIGISLDGPAFIHDAHRRTRTGLGTHASTMRGISLLKDNQIDFHIIAVITQDSLDFPDEIFNFFLDNEIRFIGFNIDEKEGNNKLSSFETLKSEEKYIAFMQRFYQLVKETNGYLKVREFEKIKKLIDGMSIKRQSTPFTMINIAHNGDFSTFSPELLSIKTSTYGNFILGNVKYNSFDAVDKTAKFKRINQDIQTGVNLCEHTCQYFSLCGGGAPSNKYFENGTFASTETIYCKYTTKIMIDIILKDIEISLGLRVVK